jgi:uncharacterized protein YbbC (DUF1343 family)
VDGNLETTAEILRRKGLLHSVLGPQHGYWAETQDNMIEWEGFPHPALGVPLHSLYGEVRMPSEAMLRGADAVLADLVDIGSRYYTYVYTMALTMRKCSEMGIPVYVADRPNPLGGELVEGPILDPAFSSFVGMYPLPVRHALSLGELARVFALTDGIPEPVLLEPWESPWVMPSPNMPTRDTALVYPGACLLEATNLSEGRGTTRPFEIFGAPWLDPWRTVEALEASGFMRGARLRPVFFIPTFQKHAGVKCGGAQIHVTDPGVFRPFLAGLGILEYCFRRGETRWNPPPYEYEYKKMPIDILAGGAHVREAVDSHDMRALSEISVTPLQKYRHMVGSAVRDAGRFRN